MNKLWLLVNKKGCKHLPSRCGSQTDRLCFSLIRHPIHLPLILNPLLSLFLSLFGSIHTRCRWLPPCLLSRRPLPRRRATRPAGDAFSRGFSVSFLTLSVDYQSEEGEAGGETMRFTSPMSEVAFGIYGFAGGTRRQRCGREGELAAGFLFVVCGENIVSLPSKM